MTRVESRTWLREIIRGKVVLVEKGTKWKVVLVDKSRTWLREIIRGGGAKWKEVLLEKSTKWKVEIG